MKRKTWMFCWLLVPLFVSALFSVGGFITFSTHDIPIWVTFIIFSHILSFKMAGISYIVFIVIVFFWLRKKDVDYIHFASKILPFFFLPICLIGSSFITGIDHMFGLIISAFTLLNGYTYVLLYHLSTLAARKLGIIKDWHDA